MSVIENLNVTIKDNQDNIADMRYQQRKEERVIR